MAVLGPEDISRDFLGWSGPALPAAADWLLREGGGAAGLGDLSGLLVVVPGGRAQRRLVELLAEQAAARGLAWVPPRVVTAGGLASHLMPAVQGGAEIADDSTAQLVRASVLHGAEAALLGALTPSPPGRGDWPGWWSLARGLGQLADGLGAAGLTPALAVERFGEVLSDDPCWAAAGELDRRYHAALGEHHLIDTHAARLAASGPYAGGIEFGGIESGESGAGPPHRVVLLAVPDLSPVHTRLLAAFAAEVRVLVFAPEQHAEGFDAWGVLRPSYWLVQPLPVEDDALQVAEDPQGQAAAVLGALERWSADAPLRPDAVTVGLGDEALGAGVLRSLGLASVPARASSGRPVTRSRPVLLLEALGALASAHRLDRFAALLRHPDLLSYLEHTLPTTSLPAGGWLGLLDRYAADHLPDGLTGQWLGADAQREPLAALYRAVGSLLPDDAVRGTRSLGEWAGPIGALLQRVYGHATLHRHAPADRPVVHGLAALGDQLERLGRQAPDAPYVPETTFAQAVDFVLHQLDAAPVPEPGGDPAVELVGLLELPLDDAGYVAVVGVNEGAVPQPIADHPMLPRHVRKALGLPGDEHRLARDQLLLTSVLASRPAGACVLISGRVGPDGGPLMPSRLVLRHDDAQMARRVARFFDTNTGSPAAPVRLTPGEDDRFLISPPVPGPQPLDRLSVTAFRDYLACPYRFYLKHLCRLRTLDDQAVELDGGAFGSIAHAALRTLGDAALRHETDAEVLYRHLSAALDHQMRLRYGVSPRPAVRLQAEQLRYRLQAVAQRQAQLVAEGWRVCHVEADRKTVEHTLVLDGEPFTLVGQIDRIDRHEDGRFRVIDYKISDTAKSPDQTHRRGHGRGQDRGQDPGPGQGAKRWIDLQLPLYRDLCTSLSVPTEGLALAYFNVPRALPEVGIAEAGWGEAELGEAVAVRDGVIRALRAQCYWPPSEDLPPFDDGLAGLCADHAADRAGLIRRSGAWVGVGAQDGLGGGRRG